MAVKRNYRINLRNYGNSPAIMVSQYDENYDLVFEVYDGVVPATGLNAYTVKLVGRQPGNDPALKYEFTGTVSGIANNILSFTIDTTMTGRAGKGTAEIVILDTTNDVKFASFNLPVYVEKAAVPDDAIDADVERAQEIAAEVQEIVDTAAATVKGEAEAWAVGQRDGVDVPSTDPAYENNAKFYAEQAAQTAEEISGVTEQVAQNTSDISDLKEELNSVRDVLSLDDDGTLPYTKENEGKYIRFSTGELTAATVYCTTNYINVAGLGEITYLRIKTIDNITTAGMAFYDVNKTYISGIRGAFQAAESGYTESTIEVPANAVYARFTIWNNETTYGEFAVSGKSILKSALDELTGKVADDAKAIGDKLTSKVDGDAYKEGYLYLKKDEDIWERGLIDATTGENGSSTSQLGRQRFRTITFAENINIVRRLDGGHYVWVFKYTPDGAFIEPVASGVSEYTDFDYEHYKYRIAFACVSGEGIESALNKYFIASEPYEIINPNDDIYQKIGTAINFYPNTVYGGVTIDNEGNEAYDSNYETTEFIQIPKKYNRNLLYTHAFCSDGYAIKVAFYNANKEFLNAYTPTGYIDNLDTFVYARVVYPVSADACMIAFSNETKQPDYAPPKNYLLYDNDLNSYDKNVISDGTITAIINTGLMYLGNEEFGYGTEHAAFAESCIKTTKDTHTSSSNYDGERYQMDCSTYVLLMMMGISPECSRYFYTKNIPSNWGYRFNRLVEYEGYVYGVPQTGNTKRLYANSIADYAYKNGYLFLVNDDLSNIRPGDVFFLSNQGASYNFFENIGHCGMVIDSIQLENGGRSIVTFEGNGGTNSPCKYHVYNSRPTRMIYAARFPMPFVHNDIHDIAEFSETVTTALSGVSGDTIDIATVEISKPLETGKVYTVCIKCNIPENCYLILKANGMSHLGVANENIIKRPDGYRTFHIFAKNTDIISTTNSITVQAKCTGSVSGSAVLSMARVYDGFMSPEFT